MHMSINWSDTLKNQDIAVQCTCKSFLLYQNEYDFSYHDHRSTFNKYKIVLLSLAICTHILVNYEDNSCGQTERQTHCASTSLRVLK